MAMLAFAGRDVGDHLHDNDLSIPGTPSAVAREAAEAHFGEAETLVVMLEGPSRQLDRQGPRLARRLDRLPGTDVLSAWSTGRPRTLRRSPDRALLIVRSSESDFNSTLRRFLPAVRAEVDRSVADPLTPRITGTAAIAEAMMEEGYGAARRGELLAAPLVLIVLLLVFRSPIAALLPAAVGFIIITSAKGALALAGRLFEIDTMALSLMSMMGLALGVDYSLLLVSRFREGLYEGRPPAEAASIASSTAGRTVVFAGLVVIVAMTIAYFVAPGAILASAAVGIVGATMLALVAAVTVLPASLALLGSNIDRWRLRRSSREGGSARVAASAVRRPVLALLLVTVPLLAMAVPARALKLGVPSIKSLTSDDRARQDFEAIGDSYGPGWAAPFEILVSSSSGPVTDPELLAELDRFQRRLARDPDVEAVVGPGLLARDALKARRTSKRGLARLDGGLRRASRGADRLGAGYARAARGSGRIAQGAAEGAHAAATVRGGLDGVSRGAGRLSTGLKLWAGGSARLEEALAQTRSATARLARGTLDAKRGAEQLVRPAQRLAAGSRAGGESLAELSGATSDSQRRLANALEALDAMSVAAKIDPHYRSAYTEVATALGTLSGKDPVSGAAVKLRYKGVAAAISAAADQSAEAARGANRLARGAKELRTGLVEVRQGAVRLRRSSARTDAAARRLDSATVRLVAGGQQLRDETTALGDGARRLELGTERIDDGARRLRGSLTRAPPRAASLGRGLDRMRNGTGDLAGESGADASGHSGSALDSGYFILAGLDASSPAVRRASSFAVNLEQGGSAARITVVPAARTTTDTGTSAIGDKLAPLAAGLGRKLGVDTAVGGRGAMMRDYQIEGSSRRLPLVAALLAVTFLVLVPVFRSPLLAFKAVVLNLLTVAAAFGFMAIAFQGSAPLLGGAGYIDIIAFYGIYAIVFALSMDYEVFLITRMREGYAASGSTRAAIAYGIERTAGIITGAALIMASVFIAFAISGVGQVAQFGVGLTVAVLIDATVVRLVLLPAAMRLFGEANWWLPGWLDRLLPVFELEARAPAAGSRPRREAVR